MRVPASSRSRVVNTRATKQAAELQGVLEAQGFEGVEFPCLEFRGLTLSEDHLSLVSDTNRCLLFTSAIAVEFMATHCSLANRLIASIGKKTALAVERYGGANAFVAEKSNAVDFASEFLTWSGGQVSGLELTLPRGRSASDALPKLLKRAGADVSELYLYETNLPGAPLERLEELKEILGSSVVLSCTSSEIVRNLFSVLKLDPSLQTKAFELPMMVIGQNTAKTARELGFKNVGVARQYTIESLVDGVKELFVE